jgi:hypothetical protein
MGRVGMFAAVGALALGLLASPGRAQTVSERYLFEAANQDRLDHQLKPLRIDRNLSNAARQHAFEMVKNRTISHRFAGEPDLAKRVGDAGAHFSLVTENVAEASNSALIHDLWMHSAGHRANLLDPQVDSVGIAVVQMRGQLYAVEDATVANLLAARGLNLTPANGDARRTCSMPTGYAGSRQPWFVMRYTSSDIHRLPDQLTERLASGKYHEAVVGACPAGRQTPFTSYSVAIMLYP